VKKQPNQLQPPIVKLARPPTVSSKGKSTAPAENRVRRKVQSLLQPAVSPLKDFKIKLPDLEFYQVFNMTKEDKLAKWKQSVKKKMRNYILMILSWVIAICIFIIC